METFPSTQTAIFTHGESPRGTERERGGLCIFGSRDIPGLSPNSKKKLSTCIQHQHFLSGTRLQYSASAFSNIHKHTYTHSSHRHHTHTLSVGSSLSRAIAQLAS